MAKAFIDLLYLILLFLTLGLLYCIFTRQTFLIKDTNHSVDFIVNDIYMILRNYIYEIAQNRGVAVLENENVRSICLIMPYCVINIQLGIFDVGHYGKYIHDNSFCDPNVYINNQYYTIYIIGSDEEFNHNDTSCILHYDNDAIWKIKGDFYNSLNSKIDSINAQYAKTGYKLNDADISMVIESYYR